MTWRPAKAMPSSHSRHSAVEGCMPVPNASPGSSRTTTASGCVTVSWRGHTHRRRPKGMAWKSCSHSRSQTRSATARARNCAGSSPNVRARAAINAASALSAANNACSRVRGHRRTSPGRGSSTASSRASLKVTLSAPLPKQELSARSGSSSVSSKLSSRWGTAAGEVGADGSLQAQPTFEIMNIEAAALKGRMREDLLVQCGVGLDPLDDQLGKRVTHARDRGVARITVRDELTNQRVIVRRDAVARIDVAVDANAGAAGRMPELDRSGRGHERARILGVDAAFDGVAAELHIGLRVGQLLAGRDRELRLDQIDTGNQFGHRMFDLNPRIHLNEIELAILVQELERARTAITDRAARLDAALTHLPALLGREARCRGLLDYFLMAALHRAVALAQTDHIAVMVAEHLKLDMPRAFEEFLHIYRVIAERGQRLGLGDRDRAQQRPLGVHDAHATPAAAARGLDDDRVADIAGDAQILFRIVAERAIGARSSSR